MASSSTSHFSLLLFFSLLAFSSAQTLTKAAEVLSNSGYKSMSVVLDLSSHSVISQSPSLTVFAPADSAFANAGHPSLNLIRYHLLPLPFPLGSLKSLPYGAKIDTLLDGHSLSVTTLPEDGAVSLNNVTVTAAPIFDDGSLIVFGINRFLDRYFRISGPIGSYGTKNLACLATKNPTRGTAAEMAAYYPFSEASEVLKSKGCSAMASFLEMQFQGFLKYQTLLTVFAPVDQVMVRRIGNLSEIPSILSRHVVPCRLSLSDLRSLDDGTALRTSLRGFIINITRYDSVVALNGISVIMPEIFHNGWFVVHGISEVLELPVSLAQSPIQSETDPAVVDSVDPFDEVPASPTSQAAERSSGEVLCLHAFILWIPLLFFYVFRP